MRRFPSLLLRIYTETMEATTFNALLSELQAIEKEAGVRDALKAGTRAVRGAGMRANELALKGISKAHRIPGAQAVIRHILDPGNTPDIAQSLASASKLLGG